MESTSRLGALASCFFLLDSRWVVRAAFVFSSTSSIAVLVSFLACRDARADDFFALDPVFRREDSRSGMGRGLCVSWPRLAGSGRGGESGLGSSLMVVSARNGSGRLAPPLPDFKALGEPPTAPMLARFSLLCLGASPCCSYTSSRGCSVLSSCPSCPRNAVS